MVELVGRLAVLAIGLLFLAITPSRAETQRTKIYRLAVFSVSARSVENTQTLTLPLLAKSGFIEGRNLILIPRHGAPEQLPALMREILAAEPDVVLAVGGEAIHVARRATATVPIVIFGPDPVRLGVADSISRPGGNVTGVVILATELDGKRLELLHEAVPGARIIAALVQPTSPNRPASERDMRAFAASARLDLRLFYAAGPADYAAAFTAMRNASAGALAIVAAPEFYRDSENLIGRGLQAGLPTVCQWSEMAASGCLLSYGPSLPASRERTAYFIARILNGAKPADLPIEQPSKVELVVNLKTAKALAITIPEAIVLRADHVIE